MPITWRNVNAPSFDASNRLAQAGAQTLQRSVQGLAGLAGNIAAENKETKTNEFLSKINQLGSLDEYEEAKKSGAFDTSGLGSTVDQAKITAAFQSRDDQLRADQIQQNQFQQSQAKQDLFERTQAEAPAMQNAFNLIAKGDYDGAAVAAEGVTDQASILNAIKSAKSAKTKAQREESTFKLQEAQRLAAPEIQAQTIAMNNELATIEDSYQTIVKNNPITRNVTAQEEEIKPGDVIANIQSNYSHELEEGNLDRGEVEKINASINKIVSSGYEEKGIILNGKQQVTKHKYPGWVLQEAFNRVGFVGGIFEPSMLGDEIKTGKLKKQADAIMRTYLAERGNIDIVAKAKEIRDNNATEVKLKQIQANQRALNKYLQ